MINVQKINYKGEFPFWQKKNFSLSGAELVFVVVLVYGLIFFLRGDLDSASAMEKTGLVPFDSYNYAAAAELGVELSSSLLGILGGDLNWVTLPLLYGFFQNIHGGGAFFVVLNSLAIYTTLKILIALFDVNGQARLWLPVAIICCSPYIWGWVLGPNKELLVGCGIMVMAFFAERKKYILLLFCALIFGLFKIQLILALALFFVFRRIPYKEFLSLAFLSLLMPLAMLNYPGLNMSEFVANSADNIKSADIMQRLEELSTLPLGMILVSPIRLVINLFAGLSIGRIIDGYTAGTPILPGVNSFIFGLLVFFIVITNKLRHVISAYRKYRSAGFLIYSFALTLTIVPFLQPRYFWWLTPYLIFFLFAIRTSSNHNSIRKYNV